MHLAELVSGRRTSSIRRLVATLRIINLGRQQRSGTYLTHALHASLRASSTASRRKGVGISRDGGCATGRSLAYLCLGHRPTNHESSRNGARQPAGCAQQLGLAQLDFGRRFHWLQRRFSDDPGADPGAVPHVGARTERRCRVQRHLSLVS